ncbi:TPA: hypothetical protein N0F65_004852 [Lagenidium giganteum]|uniref:Uncharacterized protein n=1 Tax=Lagenidium giganteum TaxID=4803 RepID=A0AAV2Z751_9STRA|nr:TPA: hypothetical protein N0F65_004852 [Lagenidium giganteum]
MLGAFHCRILTRVVQRTACQRVYLDRRTQGVCDGELPWWQSVPILPQNTRNGCDTTTARACCMPN